MNDEVSVAALLEREGWVEPRKKGGRGRVVAVMLAVVLGCGLAALLVHIGSQDPQADSHSLFGPPHGPTGGLAGGGVPDEPTGSQRTAGSTTVVVTNVSEVEGTGRNGLPWHEREAETTSSTSTSTDPSAPGQEPGSGTTSPVTTTPTTTPPAGGVGGSHNPAPPPSSSSKPRPSCLLVICW
ncbi:hypothetical protein SAMN05421835_1474 [Amycolatopsis sacchari]|uniref:Uncharacterized protein n=1 Tax=Amycolatopsis sacchari TaxID=115433 RepID=A0A1I4DIY8_9PSEU|nr:hypothetical protein [Amycolatopsis sacchari]SFK92730.1 hypothetical protein SAMN05421835_1474 [Amycolatopsis sacchari]